MKKSKGGPKSVGNKGGAKVGDLVGALGAAAPFDLAESWDSVGLQVGDPAEPITGIVVAVNLGPEALAEAAQVKANVVVCHHPPIFKPLSRLTRGNAPYLYEAVRRGISVIALHTNFDLSSEALSRGLAERLGLEFSGYLAPRGGDQLSPSLKLGKFITYVPEGGLEAVRAAVCKAGGGRIGEYSQCSFSWEGEGTFLGNPATTNPTAGKAGVLERVRERRLEVLFPLRLKDQVIKAARQAHPYEEMAYDLIELAQPSREVGYGFIGEHSTRRGNLAFHKFLDNVKEVFRLRSVTVVGPALQNPNLNLRRVAFSPGSGSGFIGAAAAKGADLYLCGEVGYHQMLEARSRGLSLALLGHSYSERFFVETIAGWCAAYGEARQVFETVHENL